MSACIEIPQCIELKPSFREAHEKILYLGLINRCDYDLIVYLQIRDEQNQLLYSSSIDLKTLEEKSIEIPLGVAKSITISGEWSLRGTALKLPLREVALNL